MWSPKVNESPSALTSESEISIFSRLLLKLLNIKLPVFIISFLLLAAIWANQEDIVTYARLLGVPLTKHEVQSIGPGDAPVAFGNLETSSGRAQNLYFKIRLSFRADDTAGHQNLFQTDDINAGIRVELSQNTLAAIIGNLKNPAAPSALVLSSKLKQGRWYDFEMTALNGQVVSGHISGETSHKIYGDALDFQARNTRAGDGFTRERRFNGEIRNIAITHGTARSKSFGEGIFAAVTSLVSLLLCFSLAAIIARKWEKVRSGEKIAALHTAHEKLRKIQASADLSIIGAVVSLVIAGAYEIIWRYFQQLALTLQPLLLPGYEPEKGAHLFKSELIVFALIELCFIIMLALPWGVKALRIQIPRFVSTSWLQTALAAVALAGVTLTVHIGEKIFCALSLVFLTAATAVRFPAIGRGLLILGNIWSALIQDAEPQTNASVPYTGRKKASLGARIAWGCVAFLLILGSIAFAAWPLAKAWYPVVLPNDYYELSDIYQPSISTGGSGLGRADMMHCLKQASARPEPAVPNWTCPIPKDALQEIAPSAIEQLTNTAQWQGATGRILYHHSYIFVPAKHFLSYGLDNRLPYLYGYGNTLFHAALMSAAGGATITAYFMTYPVAQLFGVLIIALVSGYAARDIWIGVTALLLGLALTYTIDFSAIMLAASFSPLRYAGLMVQLASIFYVLRGSGYKRSFAIPAAAAASFFWNVEFAVLGCAGQGLALLSPSLSLSRSRRFGLLGLLIAIAALFVLVNRVSLDITSTVQLGFLNVGVPLMTVSAAAIFFRSLLAGQTGLVWASFQFPNAERDARLCSLATLALVLVKYIYNPSAPHLSFTCILLAPMALVYIRWSRAQHRPNLHRTIPITATLLSLAACIWAGQSYLETADQFRYLFVRGFAAKNWSTLGESLPAITPEAPIAQRVEAIRAEMKPNDKLLILSPFDHLLSFYVNPKAICGHFEILTNVATTADIQSIVTCVQRASNVLIVYDSALEIPCENLMNSALETVTECPKKLIIKQNMRTILERLKPLTIQVASMQGLTFYRPVGASALQAEQSKIPAPTQ